MKYFPKYKLFICGKKCTSYLKELLEIKEYCHADNVIIAGEITNEERNWMYAHSEAFLFPSRLEAFWTSCFRSDALQLQSFLFSIHQPTVNLQEPRNLL